MDWQTAARGDDRTIAICQFDDQLRFQFAESWFAVLRENFGYLFTAALFDQKICIEKIEFELLGQQSAHGRFTGAHETDEGKIPIVTLSGHEYSLKELYPRTNRKSAVGSLGEIRNFFERRCGFK